MAEQGKDHAEDGVSSLWVVAADKIREDLNV